MELFSTNLLKNEYENLKKNELLKVLECGLCRKTSCDKNFITNMNQNVIDVEKNFVKIAKTLELVLKCF